MLLHIQRNVTNVLWFISDEQRKYFTVTRIDYNVSSCVFCDSVQRTTEKNEIYFARRLH